MQQLSDHATSAPQAPGPSFSRVKDVTLSVVVPLYNEELVIDAMYDRLTMALRDCVDSYEIVMVNDGSRDRTLQLALEICRRDKAVRLLNFSRNFGHQIAITAGMDRCRGRCIVVIDADLQDPPEVIAQMLEKWREGYHVVYGVRAQRKGETWFKRVTAKAFYRFLRRMTPVEIPVDTGDFRLIDRRVLSELYRMREQARFVRGMVSWVGFKQAEVQFVREERFAGETKYPLRKMLRFAIDGVLSFSQLPLKVASAFGFLSALVSFLFMVYGLVQRAFYPESVVPGWASIFSAILFIGGVQLICLGILGEYVGRIYEEVKRRPLYIVQDEVNFE
ncbi:glycosyltransferase family 2 protein [Povalibacter sp.]|uniref:glycosyltransferase family 2 protein n=1 Tax=Povalibacter sp. TaxID=1962978 RepID=UPI002F4243A6